LSQRIRDVRTLRQLLARRGLTQEATAVLAGVDTATISRICSGQARATPQTVVRLARALGIAAQQMARMCDQAWRDRDEREITDQGEALRHIDIDAMTGTR
jgi:plasmid maintenance system antidote protein VapI